MQTIGQAAWPWMVGSGSRRGRGRGGICGRACSVGSGSLIVWGWAACRWSAGGSESSFWKWRARWRLRARSAPLVVLPSASLRARYCLVAGSRCARVTAMMCSAWLSCRSPPRLRRCWVRFPEEQGIGAVPVCSAKLASERKRSLPAVWPIRIAAVSAPQPLFGQQLGAVRGDELSQLAVQRVDLAAHAAQVQRSARARCARARRP